MVMKKCFVKEKIGFVVEFYTVLIESHIIVSHNSAVLIEVRGITNTFHKILLIESQLI